MIQAAGILYVTPEGKALFLKRGPGSDHPGEWCFPGGHIEPGETAIAAAEREAVEELGMLVEGEHALWTRSIAPAEIAVPPISEQEGSALATVDYTTFLQRVPASFEPKLNGEHVGFAWAPIDQPPEPLHPGCDIALKKFGMNELDIARAIRDGRLTSPQQYQNLWLFDVRVTGTGLSYRSKLNEYVYRRPENYLTEDFLARCNGLPLIVDHPGQNILDTKQFKRRVIGASFLPYIKGDEVWAICKVHDENAARFMNKVQVSTSPGVLFVGKNSGFKMEMENGETLLIEDAPDLVDHLAVCENGVWDKGGPPVGVITSGVIGDQDMEKTEAEREAEDKERKDTGERSRNDAAAFGETLDKVLSHVDSFVKKLDAVSSRMDSIEEAMKGGTREDAEDECDKCGGMHAADAACMDSEEDGKEPGEAERVAADRGRKDAEEETHNGHARHDSVTREDLARLEARIAAPMTEAEFREMSGVQAKFDRVFMALNDSAERPLQGETKINYSIRMAEKLKGYTIYKDADLARIAYADVATYGKIEDQILKEALAVARSPASAPAGELRMVRSDDGHGHIYRDYVGHPLTWMQNFMHDRKAITGRINADVGSK